MTVQELVDIFGGTNALAGILGVGPSAVSNWKTSNHIPAQWHWRLSAEAKRRGLQIDESIFEAPNGGPRAEPDQEVA